MFKDKHIIVAVTGSLSAYKAAELVAELKTKGADVRVVMTKNATEFVAPLTFKTLSQNPVATDMFAAKEGFEVEHIAWAKWADCVLVAPATANIIGKFTCGIADDLLSSMLLAVRCPVVVVPAMNPLMYESASVQANVKILQSRNVTFAGPEWVNETTCKMASTNAVLKEAEAVL